MHRRWLALAAALPLAACGAPAADSASQQAQPIVHGTPTSHDPAVVAIVSRKLLCGATATTLCTGALIAPRAVLTAAHCLDNRRAADVRVFVGTDVTGAGETLDVVAAEVDPTYDPTSGANDVAVLTLGTAATVAPLPLASSVDAGLVGKTVRLVGFGVDENGQAGIERSGEALVESIDAALFRYTPSPANTCGGDSGGPVLYDDGSGERIIGVTRSGDAACASFGTATRVDAVSAFLAGAVDATASAASPPIYDLSRDVCAGSCTTDDDCPLAMQCLNERADGYRCGLAGGLQSGTFGVSCSADAECGAGTCLSIGSDGCRCFQPCGAAPSAPADGGGCDVAIEHRSSLGWIVLATSAWMSFLVARRRTRRQRMSGSLIEPTGS
jgi:V8-like Glu-specific endopeptidase